MSRRPKRFRRLSLVILVLCAFSSCEKDKDRITEPESPYAANNSESNLMANLITAYEAHDIDAFSELFDEEVFLFIFDPENAQNPDQDLPEYWDWKSEHGSTRLMFSSPFLVSIELSFTPGDVTPPPESDPPIHRYETKATVSEVRLRMDTIDPDGGENIDYRVTGDQATFFFQSYPDELVDGKPRVRIVEWLEDHGNLIGVREPSRKPNAPVELDSWGEIKNIFH